MTVPPSRSYRHGKRGRHRHATSPETKRWAEVSGTAWLSSEPETGHVDVRVDPPQAVSEAPTASIPAAPPPSCPSWLDEADYQALLELREGLQA